jgi:serine/threonine-protein kinase
MKKIPNGTVLHTRYKIIKPLGEGAFGIVYMVDDLLSPGVRRAAKEFSREAIPRGKEELVQRETKFLASLSHPGLPRVVDQFFDNQNFYMVMDYIEGETLDAEFVIMGEPFSEEEVIPWMFQLCDILEYLHFQDPPVIYRDLKPSNIIIDSQGELKLIDFGTARFFDPVKIKDTFIMGTPGFAAPEQYGTGQSDARSDIYAFGATFYFLLTRMNMETAKFVFPPARGLNPAITPEMEGFLAKCMHIDPKERFETVREVKKALKTGFKKNIAANKFQSDEGNVNPEGEASSGGDGLWLLFVLCGAVILFLFSIFLNPESPSMKSLLFIGMVALLTVNIISSSIIWLQQKKAGSLSESRVVPVIFWGTIALALVYSVTSYLLGKSS